MKNNLKDLISESIGSIISGAFALLPGIGLMLFSLWMFIKGAGNVEKIIAIPFGICSLAVILKAISIIFNGINLIIYVYKLKKQDFSNIEKIEDNRNKINKTNNIAAHIYLIGFLTFWFGILIISDYFSIRSWNDGGSRIFYFSLLFWIVGIFIIILYIKQRKD